MRIVSRLPRDRAQPGTLWVERNGQPFIEDVRIRGKADSKAAADHGNPSRNPTAPYGDHPAGGYRVIAVERKSDLRKYGPAFIRLDPISGDALLAKQNGRDGLALHGGDLNNDGTLRATNGCGRLDNDNISRIAIDVRVAIGMSEEVIYECENID